MCKELKELENNFNSVHVRHFTKADSPRTIVAAVNGDVVHVGIAKCAPNDSFNKQRGRLMASGRVLQAFRVYAGKSDTRTTFRREPLSYTFISTDEQTVEDFLNEFYSSTKEVTGENI